MENFDRYETVREYVYGEYSKIGSRAFRVAAITHTSAVDTCITLLAMSRNSKIEKAKIAALLHDFAQYTQNCAHSEHARLSSILAHKYLSSTHLFKVYEIDDICYAIAQHSHKESYDSPLCELLKDADIMARFLENPNMELTGIKKQRLLDACADLNGSD
ncbi:MAG: HD domain-containing protein [Catenisphaera adipataccumulans]|jgi:predicted hydrolase (HD superfamily)|uniref:HD domain-containing protein n=1 Tax=Catenisphaera adipataccumulans TaxID=700500 RepID=UPI003D93B4B9